MCNTRVCICHSVGYVSDKSSTARCDAGGDSDFRHPTDIYTFVLCSSRYPCIVVESKLHTNPHHFLMMAVFHACVACVKTFYQQSLLVSIEAVYTCVHACVLL